MIRSLGALLAATPDLISASLFLLCWIAPTWIGVAWLKTLMLLMLFEFVCIHASAFLMMLALADRMPRWKRTLGLLGIGAGYLGLASLFAVIFKAWWPVWAFLWLLGGKIAMVFETTNHQRREQQRMIWGVSTGAYILTVIAGAMIPVPALMLTEAVRTAAELPGKGLWVDHPERLLFSGLLYFGILAVLKFRVLSKGTAPIYQPRRSA